jgi:hypothetical protein
VDKLRSEYQVDLRVLGVASSTQMLLNDQAMDLSAWRQDFADKVGGLGGLGWAGMKGASWDGFPPCFVSCQEVFGGRFFCLACLPGMPYFQACLTAN